MDIAGLLHVNIQTAGQLNPAQPYVSLSANSIDTTIPDPKAPFGPYTLIVGALGLNSNPIDIIYSTDPTQAPSQVFAVGTSGTVTTSAENYFLVRYYTDGTKTTSYTYAVYPKYQLVVPTTTRYNAQDVRLMNGISFQAASGSSFSISVPNTNPFPQ